MEGHLVDDTGCRAGVGILDDRIAEQVEQYRVGEVGCKWVADLEHYIVD